MFISRANVGASIVTSNRRAAPARGGLTRGSRRAIAINSGAKEGARVTKAPEELAEKFTTGGGGADGFCDYDDVKEALKECEGLEGVRRDACFAQYGCNVEAVTDHYTKAAGIDKKKEKK